MSGAGQRRRMIVRFLLAMAALSTAMVPFPASCGEYAGGVRTKVVLKTTSTTDGKPIAYPATDHPEVTAMTVELAPGAETGWHAHPFPVYAWVLEGSLTVEIEGGKTYRFKAGDAIVEVVNTRHNGRNSGSTPVRLAVFYTGAEKTPNVVRTPPP